MKYNLVECTKPLEITSNKNFSFLIPFIGNDREIDDTSKLIVDKLARKEIEVLSTLNLTLNVTQFFLVSLSNDGKQKYSLFQAGRKGNA